MTRQRARAYQPDQASAKIAAAGLAGVLGLGVIGALVAFGLRAAYESQAPRPRATPIERAAIVTQGPRLETDPNADRAALEAQARARLQAYGWTDRAKGLAHIPIDRAMAMQAQAGWPDPEPATP
ncbi:hypothetical protein [Phenylobacterium sp.]|jgi:hypothetical protein|uniref:hypothetical protein n=1 Tax=Phenylobacterium sp. TaxID=1871053 RepID=UPI002F3F8F8A